MSVSTSKKKLVSEIRDGEFVHPGGAQIISRVMSGIEHSSENWILDVGSGLGGTSNRLLSYGQVAGIDIDEELVVHSRQHYPSIQFTHGDAHSLDKHYESNSFDVATLFSSFFYFSNQALFCEKLADACKPEAKLRIIDYATPLEQFENPFHKGKPFNPIHYESIQDVLGKWRVENITPVNDVFEKDYQSIINHMNKNKQQLISKYGEEPYDRVFESFNFILQSIHDANLGGAILSATLRK